ncbi:actin-associated protein FAM107A isoform X1 [Kryptolebias marmoratus]|uniref:actin-associated protein FAM107A isoform X1 n=1 Tax=Kryptolebias marmoratus TaxID=37003 RepID=UPI0018ACC950|nr:actin-associated protein FAM107A isoform X1 [Kryptolebias marmoratus]
MGAVYGKKKSYSIDHEPLAVRTGKQPTSRAYADLQQHCSEGVHRRPSPVSSYVPPPDYLDENEDLIKPKKLVNPVKASRSHQELHRELLSSCRRGGTGIETKPELQRVLESRKRDQLIRQRKEEVEAHRKISPLEAELLKRHRKLEELEQQQQQQQKENLKAPEFIKVREKLRRTSVHCEEEKDM